MKTYEQRTEDITQKANKIKSRRKAWISAVAGACCVALIVGIVVPLSLRGGSFDINDYQNSAYFSIIRKIYDYNQKYLSDTGDSLDTVPGVDHSPGDDGNLTSKPEQGDKYEETTLNQVDGVIEGDILKRSKNYAFYLTTDWEHVNGDKLSYYFHIGAYSLRGEDSALVGECDVKADNGVTFNTAWFIHTSMTEMYLSENAETLTLVTDCYNKNYVHYTCVISFDVSNPTDIKERSRTYVAGQYLSSRKVDGELLLITKFYIPRKPDYGNPETFVPSCGALSDRKYFTPEEIYAPESLSECTYTVVAKMNESDLIVTSKQAVLSYAFDVAVSNEHVFVIRNEYEYTQNDRVVEDLNHADAGKANFRHYSEIVCLSYTDELKNIGCIRLDGSIVDRYSLDEKDGILRVVTQTMHQIYTVMPGSRRNPYTSVMLDESNRSASLFCVGLENMTIVSRVENFADNGETVQAVRFDGDSAYVCTAIVSTDPVFVFDLSDIYNITYKDTGTIPGYSINLIKFGDYLLGIGYGEMRDTLKIELYKETDSRVESVAIYEKHECTFSAEYKAHFIDAEHGLVGLQIYDYEHPENKEVFVLLKFDADALCWNVALWHDLDSRLDLTRAFYSDGLYLIGSDAPLTFFSESEIGVKPGALQ